jgi:hypothetical protein
MGKSGDNDFIPLDAIRALAKSNFINKSEKSRKYRLQMNQLIVIMFMQRKIKMYGESFG